MCVFTIWSFPLLPWAFPWTVGRWHLASYVLFWIVQFLEYQGLGQYNQWQSGKQRSLPDVLCTFRGPIRTASSQVISPSCRFTANTLSLIVPFKMRICMKARAELCASWNTQPSHDSPAFSMSGYTARYLQGEEISYRTWDTYFLSVIMGYITLTN
jgi:hypothetical protein